MVCWYVAESAIFVQWTGQSPTEPSFRHFSGSKIRNAKQPADPSGGVLSWKGMKKGYNAFSILSYIHGKKIFEDRFPLVWFSLDQCVLPNQSFNLIT
jgi:hypothetical protein